MSVSSSGSSPVVAATWLISASRVSSTARRVYVREGDFPPVPTPEARLDHTGQRVPPGRGERAAVCSSGC